VKKGEELEILATKQTEMEKSDKVFGVGSRVHMWRQRRELGVQKSY